MQDELLAYYQQELDYLRHMGAEFAQKYPKAAQRLMLEADASQDPHVERLLEGFAFLAARVHLKIDDEFPEITEALLSILYPHYIRPVPSMSVVQFHLDPDQAKAPEGVRIPRNTPLFSKPVAGVPCQFRTCYDTRLWPVEVVAAEWKPPDRLTPPVRTMNASGAVRIELRCVQDLNLSKTELDTLRFYLHGPSGMMHTIYEILLTKCVGIMVRDPTPGTKLKSVFLPPSALSAVGFEPDQGMLNYPRRSFIGYRLLQEYFAFPDKFLFLDIEGLEDMWRTGFQERAELVFLISSSEHSERMQNVELGITDSTFRLGCVPVINLFEQTAEPILLDQRKFEYPIVPDVRRPNATEVFSVDEVVSIDPQTRDVTRYEPFYSYRHATAREKKQTFWIATRRQSTRLHDDGTEMSLSLVDLSSRPILPKADSLTIRTTCTNRDLPSRLPFGSEAGDFDLESTSVVRRIVALRKPTAALRPYTGRGVLWRLISHLSLNYLSLVSEGKQALQEILKLYNFSGTSYTEQQIEGILTLTSKRHFARVVSEDGIAFARGSKVNIELDEEKFVGGGSYLFASVVERFLGQYASLNSFSQLTVLPSQRKEVKWEWPPRAGQKVLL